MKTFNNKTVKVLDKIYCDMCGSCCTDDNFGTECATLEALWGYNSSKDGTKCEIHLCEKCFDNVVRWMKVERGRNINIDDPNAKFGNSDILDM